MKRLILSAILYVLSITISTAQLNEGLIKFEIEVSASNPQMEMAVGMMQGSTMNLYFADEDVHSEMNLGSMMTMSTIVLGKSEEVMILMSGMMGNKAIPTTLEAIKEKAPKGPDADFSVELIDETKQIQGYTCKKAVLTNENGDEMFSWYTTDIEINTIGQSYHNEKIPGFPLEYNTSANGLIMTISAVAIEEGINKKKKKELFSTKIPEGYTKMSAEDLEKMGGM
ncbi:MAG: DUF4412 domain-containing protein [Crocinitomicaceae bacterium]|jgi:GLPGLI family protein